MGGIDPVSVTTGFQFGEQGVLSNAFGMDSGMLGTGEAERKAKKKEEARQASAYDSLKEKTTSETYAPDAKKYDQNAELEQRSNSRRRYLLEQSTGRQAPTAPQIQPQQKTLL